MVRRSGGRKRRRNDMLNMIIVCVWLDVVQVVDEPSGLKRGCAAVVVGAGVGAGTGDGEEIEVE